MDTSILKLLEEDNEDESMFSKEDVDASQASLLRELEGGNNSSSQQFAIQNNGIQDANTNNLHIPESTQMKEEQQSFVGNQGQELKPEAEYHAQKNLPQDHRQLWENLSHVAQESNLQLSNNSISTEPERPQPLQQVISRRTHGLEQPVASLNHGPTQMEIRELLRILILQVDKDRGTQLHTLYSKFKRKEITKDWFLRQVRGVVGDPMTRWAVSKRTERNKGIKVPGGPDYSRESFTSAGISAKTPDTCGPHVNQLPSTSSGTLCSSATVQGLRNFERPTSENGPSKVRGGPIAYLQNISPLPLYSAPCHGSVTKVQTVSPSSSVVHVKQKSTDQSFDQVRKPCSLVQQDVSNVPVKQSIGNPRRSNDDLEKQSSKMVLSTSTTHESFSTPSVTTQLPSSTMVNFPAPAETILAGSIVRTTPKVPFVGQKKPLEALGSSLPPASKKQRLWGTSLARSDDKFNDVTALGGINIMEEEKILLPSRPKEDSGVSKAFRRVVHGEEGRMILQKVPLQRKLAEIMAKSGLKHISGDVERCLSLCVEERMRRLLSNIIRMSKQRTDPEKYRNRTCITSDLRKQINEMNQKAKEEWERKHGREEKLKNEENDAAKEDNPSEQANKKEEDERRTKAANVAALASLGGYNPFIKWKLMAEACQKPSSGPRRNSKNLSGETGGSNQSPPKVVRSISVKDVIAVLEKEPQMSRSTLLYRLYNRVYSDVRTQEKT